MAVAESELQERERELDAVAEALETASQTGRMLVVEGPAGIGKTRLLRAARRLAGERGMRVLTARASELETGIPFGIVRQLLGSVVRPGSDALMNGAAAQARPVFELDAALAQGDPFPKLNGLFWLLHDLTVDEPALLVVDDMHWADELSLHWLSFLAPRLEDLRVAVVASTRPPVATSPPLLARLLVDADTQVLRPDVLGDGAVARWTADVLEEEPAPAFVAACAEVSGGNPFFVSEVLREVERRGLGAGPDAAAAVHSLAPESIASLVMLRLADAPQGARELAQAVAILGPDTAAADAAALAGIDPDLARDAAVALVRAGVLADRVALAFEHPVIGSAVLASIEAPRAAAAHRAAAKLLLARGAPDEEVASHLVASDPNGDARTVAVLRRAAGRALGLGAPRPALALLERATVEGARLDDEHELALEVGRAAAAAGDPAALDRLRRAVQLAPGPVERARATLELGRAAVYSGGAADMVSILERTLADAPTGELAELLEVELLGMASMSASAREHLSEHRAALLPPAADAEGWQAAATWAELAFDSGARGAPVAEGAAFAAQVPRALGGRTEPPADFIILIAMAAALFVEEWDLCDRMARSLFASARERGTALPLTGAASFRGWMYVRSGRLREAESDAAFAIALAEEVAGIDVVIAVARATRALVDVERGAPETVLRGRLEELAGDLPDTLPYDTAIYVRGVVRAALGDHAGALEEYRAIERRNERWAPGPMVVDWRTAAVFALRALGDLPAARALADENLGLARRAGGQRILGVALRAAARVAEREGPRRELLDEALGHLAVCGDSLEHARALVDLGSDLRRARRVKESREPLRQALDAAERCGADALARRAREELLATGVRPRRAALSGTAALTPAERRVADLAAEGRTNREIAQHLFVTPKTVENHLRAVYDKLGVPTRHDIAAALAG